jgi:hypothetical protein
MTQVIKTQASHFNHAKVYEQLDNRYVGLVG